jgi:ketosteroid isomerase-like protein
VLLRPPTRATALLPACLLAAASFLPAQAQQDDPLRPLKEEVWRVEQRRLEALVMEDWKTLETMLSDQLTYTHSDGSLETKEQFMKALRSGAMQYLAMQHEDALVRVYGGSALLTGVTRVRVRRGKGADPMEARLRFTLLYANEGGWWRVVAWQSTRLPEEKPPPR